MSQCGRVTISHLVVEAVLAGSSVAAAGHIHIAVEVASVDSRCRIVEVEDLRIRYMEAAEMGFDMGC